MDGLKVTRPWRKKTFKNRSHRTRPPGPIQSQSNTIDTLLVLSCHLTIFILVWGFSIKILYATLISTMHAASPANHILQEQIVVTMVNTDCKP